MIENIRAPGTHVKITSKSLVHAGIKGVVVKDYLRTILIKVDDETHRYAYRSRIGVNDQGLDPKGYLEGKFIMAYPHTVIEIARPK